MDDVDQPDFPDLDLLDLLLHECQLDELHECQLDVLDHPLPSLSNSL